MKAPAWMPSLLLAASCGATPSATSPPVIDNAPTPGRAGDAVACPTGAALDEVARRAFAREGEQGVLCVAAWAGEPLWVLDGWIDVPGDDLEGGGITFAMAVVTPTGEVGWKSLDDGHPPSAIDRRAGDPLSAIDLDGDGDHELIGTDGWWSHGYETLTLLVYDLVDRTLVHAASLPLVDDNSFGVAEEHEIQACRASFQIVDGPEQRKEVVIVAEPGATHAGESCPLPGTHRYRWDGVRMVEI